MRVKNEIEKNKYIYRIEEITDMLSNSRSIRIPNKEIKDETKRDLLITSCFRTSYHSFPRVSQRIWLK